ncbi:MAG: hypothetical protein E7097_03465 [Bacteroides sp.]|nr:hypothetical protein [Bacteroides sp.]
MATGKCVNIMKKCPKALSKEIQEADKANFVCEICGKPLVEVNQSNTPTTPKPGGSITTTTTSPTPWILIISIVAAVALLGGGGYYAYTKGLFGGGEDTEDPEKIPAIWISIMEGDKITLKQGESKHLSLDCDPSNANDGVIWTSNNESVVTVSGNGDLMAVAPGKANVTVTTNVYKKTDDIQVVVKGSTTPPSWPSYGKYEGERKNGKAHGIGRLEFTQEHIINSHDIQRRKAKPGEYIQGQFVNGEITIGKHFDANGKLIQALNFGVAPSDEDK